MRYLQDRMNQHSEPTPRVFAFGIILIYHLFLADVSEGLLAATQSLYVVSRTSSSLGIRLAPWVRRRKRPVPPFPLGGVLGFPAQLQG